MSNVYSNNILETLSLQELARKNIYDVRIDDGIVLSERPGNQYKFLNIVEKIIIGEVQHPGGIHNLRINESLIINQAILPRVDFYDVYEHLLFVEFINPRVFQDKLILLEIAAATKVKTAVDVLTLLETLTLNVTRNLVCLEVLAIGESLAGYMIDDSGTPVGIIIPYCAPPPSLVIGIIMQETPVGTIDGVNRAFTISFPPSQPNSLLVYMNGLLQRLGADYVFSGTTITFNIASVPHIGDTLLVYYVR